MSRAGYYERKAVEGTTRSGETLAAVVYLAGPGFEIDGARPSREYLGRILDGARHHGLPVG